MTKSVFISYRREDAAVYARGLHDRLKDEFQVFMDVDNIPLGQDFRALLGDAVGSCDVLIVCVGKSWANAADEDGNRRLEHQQDFVRFEIAAALERDIQQENDPSRPQIKGSYDHCRSAWRWRRRQKISPGSQLARICPVCRANARQRLIWMESISGNRLPR